MKFKTILFALVAVVCLISCEEKQLDYSTTQPDVEVISVDTLVPISEAFTAEELTELRKAYVGPTYWTVTGDYEVKYASFPTAQTKRMVLQKVHWYILAYYGPERLLIDRAGHRPVPGSIDYHPAWSLPTFKENLPDHNFEPKKDKQ